MKSTLGILFVLFSLTSFAQFPAPSNLNFNYEYITSNESGYCAEGWVNGPTYCSHFSWTAADTITTTANFEHYNLYYYRYWGSQDSSILATSIETVIDMEIGIMGELWVTAVYSDPIGESEPSNIEINDDLPISIDENSLNKVSVFYNHNQQNIILKNTDAIAELNIFDSQGKQVKSLKAITNNININHLQKGLYLIEIHLKNKDIIRHKIIK